MAEPRDESKYGTGHDDGLTPLVPLDPNQATTVDALVRAMTQTQGRPRVKFAHHAELLEAAFGD